jgi:hypothetical protein
MEKGIHSSHKQEEENQQDTEVGLPDDHVPQQVKNGLIANIVYHCM